MSDRWCPAEVLHVSADHPSDVLAFGIILYLPGDTWDEQVQEVEFLQNKKLRCAADQYSERDGVDQLEENESNAGVNGNPELQWRFRRESVSESHSDSFEDEWEPAQTGGKLSARTGSSSHLQPPNTDAFQNELISLCEGHAIVVLQVEKLKRIVMSMSRDISCMRNRKVDEKKCVSANCVLPRLRQKLALKIQSAIKNSVVTFRKRKYPVPEQENLIVSVDGLRCDVLKAKVECTLRQFESVSRHISVSTPSYDLCFSLAFSFTQIPSTSRTVFRVLFRTFTHLCDSIGLDSTADRKEIALKCGKSLPGEQLRMLGTYEFDEGNVKQVARFYPVLSFGTEPDKFLSESDQIQSGIPGQCLKNTNKIYHTYTMTTREWDKVDQLYAHGLRREFVALPPLNANASDKQAFAITWKRAGDIVGRGWSDSLYESSEVFGWLEVALPHVIIQGRQLCREFGWMINDDI